MITWTPIPDEAWHFGYGGYTVYYEKEATGEVVHDYPRVNGYKSVAYPATSLILTDLDVYVFYEVWLKAYNDGGYGPNSTTTTFGKSDK